MGSLTDLSYALASTEQDFIAPENVQALIWKEIVPDLLVSATLPRWWSVSPNELHAVALYQRSGEELVIASVKDPQLRTKVVAILSDRLSPQRLERSNCAMQREDAATALLPRMMPADTFYLAEEFRTRYPAESASTGRAAQQLDTLCKQYPARGQPRAPLERLRRPSPNARSNLQPRTSQRKALPLLRRILQPTLRRVMGVHQSVLGPHGGRDGLSARDVEPPRPRTHTPHDRKDLRNRPRRLAGNVARHERDRRRAAAGQDRLSANRHRYFASTGSDTQGWIRAIGESS